ncbi:MAG TPA: hypothetical protein PL033_03210 [Candidatus Brocadiia bacterium]|nr:hypothetical protein [Candidatus Brocadiia bacterium]
MSRKMSSIVKSLVAAFMVAGLTVLTGCDIPWPDPIPDPGEPPAVVLDASSFLHVV